MGLLNHQVESVPFPFST